MAVDVVDLIIQDHREVQRLLAELKDNPKTRPTVTPMLTTLGDQPAEETKQEAVQQARNAGISGASKMSKDEIHETLKSL